MICTGEPLARALETMEAAAKQLPMNVNPAQASAYIVNPLGGRRVNMASLLSTRPTLARTRASELLTDLRDRRRKCLSVGRGGVCLGIHRLVALDEIGVVGGEP